MTYDFDTLPSRRHTDSMKWNISDHELPMWVADMDFMCAPEIEEALLTRVKKSCFGYGLVTDEWYDAYVNWWKSRHGMDLDRDALIFTTGVIPLLSSCVRKLTTPNENVVVQSPVYDIFLNSINNNGARVLDNPLVYGNGVYTMDFTDLEKKFADPQTSLMILCNPQNPTGNIWGKDELSRIGELADRYGVTVISDEIHCDITSPGYEYTPFASVSEVNARVSITAMSPTKAFNLAGLQTAAAYVPDKRLRHKVWRALNTDEVAEPNSFAVPAAVAAFTRGGAWLDELRLRIEENREIVADYFRDNIPQLKLVESHATYLLWVDISATGMNGADFAHRIRRTDGLFISRGTIYGKTTGSSFIRMNIACPRDVLMDGLGRLESFCNCSAQPQTLAVCGV